MTETRVESSIGTRVTLKGAGPDKSGIITDLVSPVGSVPTQPVAGLSLANAPAVVVVKLRATKLAKTGNPKKVPGRHAWGIVSQSVPDTVLLPLSKKYASREDALKAAQEFVADAIHAPGDSQLLVRQPHHGLVNKKDLALQHELAGLRADQLVSLASWPDSSTHHSGNVLRFGTDGVVSEFSYAVPPDRRDVLSLRVRAYMLLHKK
jgi:hypothetical protein